MTEFSLLCIHINECETLKTEYELKITFALLRFENAQMQSIISKDRQQDDGRIRYMYNLITSSAELLWSFICFEHRDKSCSHHFVQNVASQTS
ncbi:hypothetical protein Tsp_03360, partial [Trichinella spiralis]|uniref:hypothetical protein n=1 Tax=Trichinella spiralis TaxID=6334 RepID=UPI0001EFCBA9